MTIACKIKGHQADRGGARHDGEDYWTTCKRCNVPLIRDSGGWRTPIATEIEAHELNVTRKAGLHSAAGISDGR